MKKFIILSLMLLPFAVKAQWQTEYNRNGDEAMERKDYGDAKFWYEEGVANCDRYSIDKLTEIWMLDESMRISMRTVMGRCLSCLNEQALAKDSLAIRQLIDYYSEGIGTAKNEISANHWKEQLEQLRRPVIDILTPNGSKERMRFFAGYHASPVAPYGIQVGGMGKSVGWYIRLRSNFVFQETQYDYTVVQNLLKIEELDNKGALYRATAENVKKTYLTGSVGIMLKVASNMFISAGAGYWDRKDAREFIEVNDDGSAIPGTSGWARLRNSSMNGVMLDLDGTYVISGKFYGTLGASLMDFKYVYPSIGIGIFF